MSHWPDGVTWWVGVGEAKDPSFTASCVTPGPLSPHPKMRMPFSVGREAQWDMGCQVRNIRDWHKSFIVKVYLFIEHLQALDAEETVLV